MTEEYNPTFESLEKAYKNHHGLMLQPIQVQEIYGALMDAARDIFMLRGALEVVNDAIEGSEDLDPQEEEHDDETEEVREGTVEE